MNRLTFLLFFSGILILLISCSRKNEITYQPLSQKIVTAGALLSLTGGGSSSGESSQTALSFAVADINAYMAACGIPFRIQIVVADTKTDTSVALAEIKKMYDQGIRVVIGPYSSAEVAAVKPFVDRHGMLLVSPSSVAVSLAIPGDNVFRFVSCDLIQGEAMSEMLTEDSIKLLVPLVRNDLWGSDLLTATANEFSRSGGQLTEPLLYDPASGPSPEELNQLNTVVLNAFAEYPAEQVAVYALTFGEGTTILRRASGYSGLDSVKWYGSSAFALNGSVKSDTQACQFAIGHGFPCPLFGLDAASRSKWEPLIQRIEASIHRQPEVYALTAYDALWVAALSLNLAGATTDIKHLITVFTHQASLFSGVTGNTALNESGDRAEGNYDFWGVHHAGSGYDWKVMANYNSATGVLTRY